MLLLVSIASGAYLFDSVVSHFLPVTVIDQAPAFSKYLLSLVQSPVTLLMIYLASLLELTILFKGYSVVKKWFKTSHRLEKSVV